MANLEKSASFSFIKSYSLTTEIGVKLCSLEGEFLSASDIRKEVLEKYDMKFSGMHQSKRPDLMAMLRVYADGKELCLPTSSSYKAFTNQWNWSEYIKLPINYSDLPRNALLAITLYDCVGATELRAVGGTTLPLFGKRGLYRRGLMDLRVWPLTEADGSPTNNLTPGKMNDKSSKMYHLRKLVKQYQEGLLPPVEWLDRLTFREIEVIKKREKSDSPYLYLTVEFPEVTMNDMSFHVVYYEEEDDDVIPCKTQGEIVTIPDTEIGLDNLVERKHHILSRSVRSGISDKDAKPNAAVRDQLNNIVGYPPTKQLTTEEQDLIWKFRFYLSNQKKASVKFLECVNWKLPAEVKQALDLLAEWAPMGVEDALGLLGPKFQHPAVRRYAVTRLKQASDEDLLLYLLQLVQALKYENFEDINKKYKHLDELISSKDNGVAESLPSTSSESSSSGVSTNAGHNNEVMQYYKTIFDTNTDMDLATFLIYRACGNFNLANYFYWYLMVECEDCESSTVKQDSSIKNMYLTVRKTFLLSLRHGSAEMQKKAAYLKQQKTFVTMLMQLVKNVARENGNRKKKIEHLRSLLKENDPSKFNFSNFDPLPFPLDPTVHIKGIVPEKATLFNSHLMPSKLTFLSTNYKEYVTIFKNGDDLRQDQLVLQIITLMDKLLRSENLDLKLTPYRVLAVSIKHGFVQFVESVPVAEVLATCGTIQNFFRKYHPSENGSYGISPDIMDTYVKSCAGYCVIAYLLGVGDRHFDNLLLTTTGKLFHIDFGYILGRDPKPLPPPMKLSKEMVEAMGGVNSEHYNEFRKLCYVAFLHLRRHSNLILNLFTLMVNANVPDIALEPDKAVMKVQEKFRLDLGDEEAVHYFQNLLDMSVTAVMAALVEQLHKFAQYWRNS